MGDESLAIPSIIVADEANKPGNRSSNTVSGGAKKPGMSTASTSASTVEFNLIARMNQLSWNMFDTGLRFGQMAIKELSVSYALQGIKTSLQCQLRKVLIDYANDVSPCYKQIISCTGDGTAKKFFDLSLTIFDTTFVDAATNAAKDELNDSLNLTVGKIKVRWYSFWFMDTYVVLTIHFNQVICLVKFVNELIAFFDPIINPLPAALTEQMKEQAIEKVKSAYQEQQSVGKKIFLNIHIKSPQMIIPQNSRSLNGFLVDLGNLNVTNRFVDVPSLSSLNNDGSVVSVLDQISFSLDNLEVKRVVFENANRLVLYLKLAHYLVYLTPKPPKFKRSMDQRAVNAAGESDRRAEAHVEKRGPTKHR